MKYQQKFNTWLGPFPIEFDYTSQLYTYKRDFFQLKFYYFIVFASLYIVNVTSTFFLLVLRLFYPDPMFKNEHFIIFFFILIVMGFLVAIAISIFLYGKIGVQTLNALMVQFRNLNKILKPNKPCKKFKKPIGIRQQIKQLCYEENGSLDILGIAILYFATYSLWFHYMVAFGALVFDVNPMRHFAHALLGNKFMNQFKVRVLGGLFYFIVLFFNTSTGVRLCQVIVNLFVIPLQFKLKIIRLLNELYARCDSEQKYAQHIHE